MTWIRIECDLRDHAVVGLLADDLKVDTDRALALYLRTLLGFGDHRADGQPAFVADATLEEWAKWKGRRGRFAAAFRERCIERREEQKDPPGTIKGWWRQAALLREQERSRNRPGQGTREAMAKHREGHDTAPDGHREGTAVPSRGNEDGDVNEQRTTQSVGQAADPPAPEGSDVANLLTGMGRTVDRWAVFNFLERVPESELAAWTRRLAGYLQGLDFPAGVQPTPEQLATACRDFTGDFKSPAHFRAFVMRAIQGPRPRPNGQRASGEQAKTERSLAAAERFAKGGSRAGT